MPLFLAIGGLLISTLWGITAVLDKFDDVQEDVDKTALYLGGLVLVSIGGMLIYRELKSRK